MSVTDPTDPTDSLPHISDRYVIHEKLGVGGVGKVYRALDRSCDAEVAIKLLRSDLAEQETHRLRFLREFRAVSRLDHPGCLKVFEQGMAQRRHYFTMEYVPGRDLRFVAAADARTRLHVLHRVAKALEYIHAHRLVHRD